MNECSQVQSVKSFELFPSILLLLSPSSFPPFFISHHFSLISQTKTPMSNSSRKPTTTTTTTLFLSCFFIISYSLSLFSHAADLLKQGESLKDDNNNTIISSEQTFALGFFTPENSTTGYRYVGIWYHQIPGQTIVWIANRENPIPDKSGIFTIGVDGNLMIADGRGNTIWSANVSGISPTNNLTAILENTGNFRLCRDKDIDDSNKFLWQSFDYPTDTFLPGMRVGLNLRTGKNHIFTSWKSSNDPSMGEYNLGVDSAKLIQIVIRKGSKRRWRSGLWSGQSFIGIPNMRSLYVYGFKLLTDDPNEKIFFTYTMANTSEILRFRIGWNGREEQLHWDDGKKEWTVFWEQPITSCDLYNQCGPSGICNMLNSPICSCPQGFVPKSINEWNKGNWTDGCVRRTALKCENTNGSSSEVAKGDGFLQLDGVKVPDFSRWIVDQNSQECLDRCLMNCSCKAYSHVNGIGCMVWDSDFLDVQKFREGGQRFYIRLDPSELGGKKKVSIIVVLIPVILGTILLCVAAYLIWRNKDKFKGFFKKKTNDSMMVYLNKRKEKLKEFSGQDDIVVDGNEGDGPEPSVYSFDAIVVATDYFSFTNKLGQGGFGPVYKGKFPCGAEIAVKRLSKKSGQGLEEFKTEIMLIAKLQHRNLVRILGCCIEGEEKMLIYEYMPNKSLDAFIFDSTNQMQLIWGKRFSIIEGIARGLLYLHRDSRLRIIHRDLKASNILLDEEMNPKISDFGMAKIFGGNQNQANTNRVVGTYGYMAPEYAMEGLFSVKSDVYSFGVLLLEIVCGKRSTSFHRRSEQSQNILGHAWQLWSEGRTVEFLDQSIRNTCSISEVDKCIQLGLLCVQDSAMDRPNMAAVVLMLESETTTLPMPKQPTFSIGRHSMDANSFSGSAEPEIVSTNDVTVTVIIGR